MKVAIFFKKQKSTTDPDITTLYNNLFKRIMRILKFCQVNRSYFNPHPSAALMIPEHKYVSQLLILQVSFMYVQLACLVSDSRSGPDT